MRTQYVQMKQYILVVMRCEVWCAFRPINGYDLKRSISPYFEMLHLEILKCNNFQNMDAGEAMEIILMPLCMLHLKTLQRKLAL